MSGYSVAKRTAEFLAEHPFCCLCGGTKYATQKEHTPSTQFFAGKWRPQQIVVPACAYCNQSTGSTDQLVAVLARLHARAHHPNEGATLESAICGLQRSLPEVAEELLNVSARQRRSIAKLAAAFDEDYDCLNVGDKTHAHLQAFGAKLALALHYWEKRRAVPETSGVIVRVWTYANKLEGDEVLSSILIALLGPEKTLFQGTKHVLDQFSYAGASADTGD